MKPIKKPQKPLKTLIINKKQPKNQQKQFKTPSHHYFLWRSQLKIHLKNHKKQPKNQQKQQKNTCYKVYIKKQYYTLKHIFQHNIITKQ